MKTVAKILATLAIAAGMALVILDYAWEPVQSSRVMRTVSIRTRALYERPDPLAHAAGIRENLSMLAAAQRAYPLEIDLYMLEAANLRLLNRFAEAEAAYHRALRFDRRPEIYLNLGAMQASQGREAEAIDNFLLCVRFNPSMLDNIDYENLRGEVKRRYDERYRF